MADDDWKRWMVMTFQKMVAETKDARTTLQAVGWFFVETLVVDRQQPSSNVHQSLLKVVYTRIKASYYDFCWRTRDRNWPTISTFPDPRQEEQDDPCHLGWWACFGPLFSNSNHNMTP